MIEVYTVTEFNDVNDDNIAKEIWLLPVQLSWGVIFFSVDAYANGFQDCSQKSDTADKSGYRECKCNALLSIQFLPELRTERDAWQAKHDGHMGGSKESARAM